MKTNTVDYRNLIELTPPYENPVKYQTFSSYAPDFRNNNKGHKPADQYTSSKQKTADRRCLVNAELENENKKKLSMGLLNSQSLKNKTLLISDLITEKNISMLFLTETWIQDENDVVFLDHTAPDGYSYHHKSRTNGSRGGGVGVIFQDCLNILDITSQFKQYLSFELIALNTTIDGQTICFYLIYRPPPSSTNNIRTSQFIPEFSDLLEMALLKSDHVCFLGYFNIPWDTTDHSERKELASMLSAMGLIQHIEDPTHSKGHTLDVVITRLNSSLFNLDHANLLLSDHNLVLGSLNFVTQRYPTVEVKYRKLKDINPEAFQQEIADADLQICENEDIDCAVNKYNCVLNQILDKFAPLKTSKVIARPKKPWYTNDIASKKRAKRIVERKLKSLRRRLRMLRHKRRVTPTGLTDTIQETQRKYVLLRNEFVISLQQAKKNYYEAKINACGYDQKKLFAILNELMCKKVKSKLPDHSSELELAERFNRFFVNKIEQIRSELDASNGTSNREPDPTSNTCFDAFEPCSEEELKTIINSTSNASCALDPIPTILLKKCLPSLLPVLTKLVNKSLETGRFPAELKKAHVRPLLKKATLDSDNLKNFRPVSNIPFLSKIIEKVVTKRLNSHMSLNSLNEEFQSAYRANHGAVPHS